MSNLKDTESFNTPNIHYILKLIKNELKYGDLSSKSSDSDKSAYNNRCQNALTKQFYDFNKGTKNEKELFRVMPVNGTEKIYFDSQFEYSEWSQRNKRTGVK